MHAIFSFFAVSHLQPLLQSLHLPVVPRFPKNTAQQPGPGHPFAIIIRSSNFFCARVLMIDLNPVLPSLKQRMQRLLGKHIDLLWIPGAKLDNVRGETANLEHALLELALRARLSLPFGGKVMVETANVEFDDSLAGEASLKAGRYVLLEMTCVRLNPEEASSFGPTSMASLSFTDTTLIAREILTNSGGALQEYSEPGKALTFRAYLSTAAQSRRTSMPVIDPNTRPTILLVEGEAFVRDVACEILQSLGYHVIPASNADEALRLFSERQPIHLLLTDVVMPCMNGSDLAEQLKLMDPALKTIYMSGHTSNPVVRKGFCNPRIAYLQKPFTLEALGQKVKEVLDESEPTA